MLGRSISWKAGVSLNIVVAINENYIEPLKTMLYSLAYNNQCPLTVYLLHKELSDSIIGDLQEYIQYNCHGQLVDIKVDNRLFASAPREKWWTEETYYRLLAFDILPQTVERALWLDADIIINKNIEVFYHQSFDDQFAVVCKGCNQQLKCNLGLPEEYVYFNAGVILFNIVKMRLCLTREIVFSCFHTYEDRLKALDQDILNVLFCNCVKYADESIYNHEAFGFNVYSAEKMFVIKKRACIIHFAGPIKPWHSQGANWADSIWWKYELKRGKWLQYIAYRIKNSPSKMYHLGREMYYMCKAVFAKVKA